VNRNGQTSHCELHDRVEILVRIVQRPSLEQRFIDVRERASQQDRVAIGAGLRDRCRAYGGAGSADVLDDDRAKQRLDLLGPWPGQ
jgi:hypothetical protein